jgi:hypothetical protein
MPVCRVAEYLFDFVCTQQYTNGGGGIIPSDIIPLATWPVREKTLLMAFRLRPGG